jgi:hypothetical protein
MVPSRRFRKPPSSISRLVQVEVLGVHAKRRRRVASACAPSPAFSVSGASGVDAADESAITPCSVRRAWFTERRASHSESDFGAAKFQGAILGKRLLAPPGSSFVSVQTFEVESRAELSVTSDCNSTPFHAASGQHTIQLL